MKSNNEQRFKVVGVWYNNQVMKDYQVRDYNGNFELWVCTGVGWMKSLEYHLADLVEGGMWEKACINSNM